MKNALLVVFVSTIAIGCIKGQSKTFEFAPTFYKKNKAFITKEIEYNPPKEALEFIGLSCYHFDRNEVTLFYRLKSEGNWSTWFKFEKQHEFVARSRSAYQTKPIQRSFSHIQFKSSEKVETSLNIRFFFANQSENTFIDSNKSFNCDIPDVCQRVCWCPTCPVDITPEFTDPTHLIVHHSAGNNQSNNFATVVEFIWDLHVNTNGWDDIGYNWLIDPNGIMYEGRLDNYQGAHFSCINENTVGICVIGDYSLMEPTTAALSTLVNLLAFETTEHSIDINAQSYHVTGDFFLDNVAGHRDSSGSINACSGTTCPGDSFYPLLDNIRLQVSELPCYKIETNIAVETNISIKVFPNPIHEYLFITSPNQIQTLEIVDIVGTSLGFVYSEKANDLSHLNAGVYFLYYNRQLIQKLIKI